MTAIRSLFVAAMLVAGLPAQIDVAAPAASGAAPDALSTRVIPPVQRELLEFAFDATVLMPLRPHGVDRCMLQEQVALCCIAHGQFDLALAYAEKITNWRRGVVQAELAQVAAEQENEELAAVLCDRAARAAVAQQDAEAGQPWQCDRIRSRIAVAYKRLGRLEDAVTMARLVNSGQTTEFETEVAGTLDDTAFEAQLQAMDGALRAGGMQEAMNLTEIGLVLLERYYGDPSRRERVLDRVARATKNMPAMAAIELEARIAGVAASQGDQAEAQRRARAMRERLVTFQMHKEDLMEVRARVARTLYEAGAAGDAIDELNETIAFYEQHEGEILNMFRADGLAPVAAAYLACGSEPAAIATYRCAIENAALNPNARPRLQDLVLIVCSMVDAGFEPPRVMRDQLQALRAGLKAPW